MTTLRRNGDYEGEIQHRFTSGHLSLIEAEYGSGKKVLSHIHSRPHVYFVVAGRFEESVDGFAHERMSGALTFLPAGASHTARAIRGSRALILDLGSEEERRLAPRCFPNEPVSIDGRRSAWLMVALRRELRARDDLASLGIDSIVSELLETLRTSSSPNAARRGDVPRWLRRLAGMLEDQNEKPPTLLEMAREAGVHPTHVSRAFRHHYRCTVSEFLRLHRLGKAVDLIQRSSKPLANVALEAGFFDQSHMTRTFRRITGMTPAEFRGAMRS